jgi:kynurenine formamidase
MGRQADGSWSEEWIPPTFRVDANGKVVDYVNDRTPNNWGRWGELDERGTVNLITPEKVAQAASLIRTGQVISCAIPLDSKGPVHPTRTGVVHLYGYTGSDFVAGTAMGQAYPRFQGTDDYIFMPLQGSTQWDGLAHFFYRDTMYNGFWIGNVESFAGARRGSIHNLKDTLVGRGVLLDIPRLKGVDRLEKGYGITPADLDAAAERQGVEVREGDILLVRTGHVPYFYSLEDTSSFWTGGAPGINRDCVQWLADKDVAALAMDNIAIEVEPFEEPFEHVYPLHARLIRDLGLTLGEVWWLEDLADACAADGRYEFFISAPPLNITNASGSPANPIVVK